MLPCFGPTDFISVFAVGELCQVLSLVLLQMYLFLFYVYDGSCLCACVCVCVRCVCSVLRGSLVLIVASVRNLKAKSPETARLPGIP